MRSCEQRSRRRWAECSYDRRCKSISRSNYVQRAHADQLTGKLRHAVDGSQRTFRGRCRGDVHEDTA
jgi:hypothetical protein